MEPPPSQDTMVTRLVLWAYGRIRYLVTMVPATAGGPIAAAFGFHRAYSKATKKPESQHTGDLTQTRARVNELASAGRGARAVVAYTKGPHRSFTQRTPRRGTKS